MGKQSQSRVLIADDNEGSVFTLSMLLELMGCEVCIARDGVQAVQAASTFRPDIVILDIEMPKMNGHEACREIRKLNGGDKMHIIALTGWSQEEDVRRSYDAGFDEHKVKPIAVAAVEAMVSASVSKTQRTSLL